MDRDPDYTTSKASADSLELRVDTEQNALYDNEHVKVITETEQDNSIVDTDNGDSVAKEVQTESVKMKKVTKEDFADILDVKERFNNNVAQGYYYRQK